MAITYSLVPEELGLRDPMLVGAFMGWPDASLGASGAIRYLVEALHASPLATWEGDDFYDFVELRPVSRVSPPRDRALVWPQAEFWVVREVPLRGLPGEESADEPRSRSVVLFLAPEPRLRWRAYGRELAAAAQRCGVDQAVFFGAAYADVPHTRMPIVTGWATEPRLRTRLEAQGVPFSAYQGPSSMQSAAIEACREAGIACASLFSNGPSYLTIPNANLSLAILRRLAAVFELNLDLKIMEDAAEALVRQVNSAIEDRSDQEFREHLRRLEAQFDEQAAPLAPGELRRQQQRQEEQAEQAEASAPLNVDPQDVVRELEDFLRRRQQRPPGAEEGPREEGPREEGPREEGPREPDAGEDEGRSGRRDDAEPPPGGGSPGTPI